MFSGYSILANVMEAEELKSDSLKTILGWVPRGIFLLPGACEPKSVV